MQLGCDTRGSFAVFSRIRTPLCGVSVTPIDLLPETQLGPTRFSSS